MVDPSTVDSDPHAILNRVCQIICMICLAVLCVNVMRTVPSMLADISHARLSISNGATRTSSLRFSISKLGVCVGTLIPCTLFAVAPFFPHDGDQCYKIITAAAFFYVTHKFLVYLFYLLKSRLVRPLESFSRVEKGVFIATSSIVPFAAMAAVFVHGRIDEETCGVHAPLFMAVIMLVADCSLSCMYLYLFVKPLHELTRRRVARTSTGIIMGTGHSGYHGPTTGGHLTPGGGTGGTGAMVGSTPGMVSGPSRSNSPAPPLHATHAWQSSNNINQPTTAAQQAAQSTGGGYRASSRAGFGPESALGVAAASAAAAATRQAATIVNTIVVAPVANTMMASPASMLSTINDGTNTHSAATATSPGGGHMLAYMMSASPPGTASPPPFRSLINNTLPPSSPSPLSPAMGITQLDHNGVPIGIANRQSAAATTPGGESGDNHASSALIGLGAVPTTDESPAPKVGGATNNGDVLNSPNNNANTITGTGTGATTTTGTGTGMVRRPSILRRPSTAGGTLPRHGSSVRIVTNATVIMVRQGSSAALQHHQSQQQPNNNNSTATGSTPVAAARRASALSVEGHGSAAGSATHTGSGSRSNHDPMAAIIRRNFRACVQSIASTFVAMTLVVLNDLSILPGYYRITINVIGCIDVTLQVLIILHLTRKMDGHGSSSAGGDGHGPAHGHGHGGGAGGANNNNANNNMSNAGAQLPSIDASDQPSGMPARLVDRSHHYRAGSNAYGHAPGVSWAPSVPSNGNGNGNGGNNTGGGFTSAQSSPGSHAPTSVWPNASNGTNGTNVNNNNNGTANNNNNTNNNTNTGNNGNGNGNGNGVVVNHSNVPNTSGHDDDDDNNNEDHHDTVSVSDQQSSYIPSNNTIAPRSVAVVHSRVASMSHHRQQASYGGVSQLSQFAPSSAGSTGHSMVSVASPANHAAISRVSLAVATPPPVIPSMAIIRAQRAAAAAAAAALAQQQRPYDDDSDSGAHSHNHGTGITTATHGASGARLSSSGISASASSTAAATTIGGATTALTIPMVVTPNHHGTVLDRSSPRSGSAASRSDVPPEAPRVSQPPVYPVTAVQTAAAPASAAPTVAVIPSSANHDHDHDHPSPPPSDPPSPVTTQ